MDYEFTPNDVVYAGNNFIIVRVKAQLPFKKDWLMVYKIDETEIRGLFPDYLAAREYVKKQTGE